MAKEKPNYGVTDENRRNAAESISGKSSSMLMDIDGAWRPCPGRPGYVTKVITAGKRIRLITKLEKSA